MYSNIRGKYKALKEAYRLAKEGDENWKEWFSLSNRISEYYSKIPLPERVYEKIKKVYVTSKALKEERNNVETVLGSITIPKENLEDLIKRQKK